MTPPSWATGSGQWRRPRTVVVACNRRHRAQLTSHIHDDTVVVATPLDLIRHLEDDEHPVAAIVLMGSPLDHELGAFVREAYPRIVIVDEPEPAVAARTRIDHVELCD